VPLEYVILFIGELSLNRNGELSVIVADDLVFVVSVNMAFAYVASDEEPVGPVGPVLPVGPVGPVGPVNP
jgi:hypothetical protein